MPDRWVGGGGGGGGYGRAPLTLALSPPRTRGCAASKAAMMSLTRGPDCSAVMVCQPLRLARFLSISPGAIELERSSRAEN